MQERAKVERPPKLSAAQETSDQNREQEIAEWLAKREGEISKWLAVLGDPASDSKLKQIARDGLDRLFDHPVMDHHTARCLIDRFRPFLSHAIGATLTISRTTALGAPCLGELFYQGPHGPRITARDPGTPVKIKRELEEISAFLCEDAGIAEGGARDQEHTLGYWLVLLYNYNPRYFEPPVLRSRKRRRPAWPSAEGAFWVRNFPLASIEYCQQFARSKPGRPKRRATFDAKPRGPGAPPKSSNDMIYQKWLSMGKPSASNLARATSPEEFEDPKRRRNLIERCRQAVMRRDVLKNPQHNSPKFG
jgi:hypothetical protein